MKAAGSTFPSGHLFSLSKNQIIYFKILEMRERIIRAVAGSLALLSIGLAYFVNINWLFLAGFVGLNLLQSSFTRFCPLEVILKKAGVEK
jgi:hypothetical protein